MSNYAYIALIPLLPLGCFLILGLFGRKYFNKNSGRAGTLVLFVSTLLSAYAVYQYFFLYGKTIGVYQPILAMKQPWLEFSSHLSIDMSILLDPISVMMILLVCFISLMVHIFSLGYMKGEERLATYYAFLSLFTFSMLGLVLSGNIFQTYIFWELVGLSSYLLIGFYFDKPSAVAAAKKAFIVTRFADLGFLIGILILAFHAETLDFNTLIQRLTTNSPQLLHIRSASFLGISMLGWGLSLVFIGGAGKSAMFPLHVWLPDAMEGPTPVSALIHAATMVVAGVYLVARLFPVFAISDPGALKLVMYVGAISAFLAALIACSQTDIKRILAYSTISQIGFMMFALGVSGYGGEKGLGYTASLFHLFTHAFFKSLLFLCAGAVIHLIHSNEIRDLGGLRKRMPLTHFCFLIACLAISGIPPFSGFFSKEEILFAASRSSTLVFLLGLISSGLTSFYMFRLYYSIFWRIPVPVGQISSSFGNRASAEAPASMRIPLVILVVCTAVSGFLPFGEWISSDGAGLARSFHLLFSVLPVSIAGIGLYTATVLFKKQNDRPARFAAALGAFYRAIHQKLYFDEVWLFITRKIIFNLIGRPAAWIDQHIVDGLINGVAWLASQISGWIRGFQSGKVQLYTLYFFAGIGALAVVFIYLWS
jgi:NADH-quinone oxidoreductase subunit L